MGKTPILYFIKTCKFMSVNRKFKRKFGRVDNIFISSFHVLHVYN